MGREAVEALGVALRGLLGLEMGAALGLEYGEPHISPRRPLHLSAIHFPPYRYSIDYVASKLSECPQRPPKTPETAHLNLAFIPKEAFYVAGGLVVKPTEFTFQPSLLIDPCNRIFQPAQGEYAKVHA